MANANAMRLWTLRCSAVLAPVPIVELIGLNRLWGYGLLGPALAAAWATCRWRRRRRDRLAGTPAPAPARTAFWGGAEAPRADGDARESSIGLAAALPVERRDRAMDNLVRSLQNEAVDADLRVQLIQDLVDLGGRDMAMRLAPVAAASEVHVEVRLEAAEHMSRYSLEESARALESIAADPAVDGRYRLDAASALVDRAARPAGVALMRLVTDGSVSEYVRHSAANMLRPVDGGATASALRHLAMSPLVTSRLRIICAEQLAEYDAGDAEDALWRLIKGVEAIMDYHLGIDAAEAMHGISPGVGVEAYSVLAADAHFPWPGRIEAAFRLGRLGVRDGFDLLSDFACAEGLADVHGIAALDRLFQLEIESGPVDWEE